ncbi:MAG: hypothetical protein AMS17_15760 [Spirochaetes bacterium DG_61]|nr:MAG: hypothetical protein AMS17_15760 [Spirochaetes bacterium DG_61]
MKVFGNRKLIGFILSGILLLVGMAVVKSLNIPEGIYIQFGGFVVGAYTVFVTGNVLSKSKNGGEP